MHELASRPVLSTTILVVLTGYWSYALFDLLRSETPNRAGLIKLREEYFAGMGKFSVWDIFGCFLMLLPFSLVIWGGRFLFLGDIFILIGFILSKASFFWLGIEPKDFQGGAGVPDFVPMFFVATIGVFLFRTPETFSAAGLLLLLGTRAPAYWSVVPLLDQGAEPGYSIVNKLVAMLFPLVAGILVCLLTWGRWDPWGLHANLHDGLGLMYLWLAAHSHHRVAQCVLDAGLHDLQTDLSESDKLPSSGEPPA